MDTQASLSTAYQLLFLMIALPVTLGWLAAWVIDR